ncbi:MAG: VWA domain-containing protein, partial [Pseudomonas sp.]
RQQRAGRWQSLLPPAFHQVLLGGVSRRNSRLPWLALGLAWLLALLALLGPSWQRVEQVNLKRADPLVVVLDLSTSMLASDVAPNRLEQAKRKLLDLLHSRRDAPTGIVVFAGSAHTLVPLSDDLATTRNLLEALNPAIMPTPGQRADLGVRQAMALLEQGAQGKGKILLIGSSLNQQEQDGIIEALGQQGERLQILGIGTREGAPIAQEGGGFMKDQHGAILLPRLDNAGFKRLASRLGGRYSNASLDDSDLRRLDLLDRPQQLRDAEEPTQLSAWADQGHWLLLPLLLLAACAGRRGWLLCLPLLLVLPQPSYAFEFNDLWLRPDQQGQRLLEAQKPAEAAQHFTDPQWQAQALYQAGDYNAAAERFAQGYSAADHYNRGTALAKAGELEAALDAYDQALERQPQMPAALANKALVEQALAQRQQQKQQEQEQKQQQQQQQQDNAAGASAAPQSPQNPANQAPASKDNEANAQPAPPPGEPAQSKAQQAPSPGQTDKPATPGTPASAKPEPSDADTPAQAANNPPGNNSPGNTDPHQREPASPSDEAPNAPLDELGTEQRQALEQWLRQIPDEPGELLRRKFWYEQQQRQEQNR